MVSTVIQTRDPAGVVVVSPPERLVKGDPMPSKNHASMGDLLPSPLTHFFL